MKKEADPIFSTVSEDGTVCHYYSDGAAVQEDENGEGNICYLWKWEHGRIYWRLNSTRWDVDSDLATEAYKKYVRNLIQDEENSFSC